MIHLSIRGDSPLYAEILKNPATVTAIYAAPDKCELNDREVWAAANPGLACGIKQTAYMEAEVKRIEAAPSDVATFRAFDLNQALDPTREMILLPSELDACVGEPDFDPKRGRVVLGFDFGESLSGTAAVAIWPQTRAVRTWLAFGYKPSLRKRGQRDNADYVEMERGGELRTYLGRIVPVHEFLADVAADLGDFHVCMAGGLRWLQESGSAGFSRPGACALAGEISDGRGRAGWRARRAGLSAADTGKEAGHGE